MPKISEKNKPFIPTTEQLAFAKQAFDALKIHWQGDGIGMSRPGYGAKETEAMQILCDEARKMGATIYVDAAGNRHAVFKGKDRYKPVITMGSHLDSVERGGQFDGPAGVVGALQAIKIAQENDLEFPQDVVVTMWRNEESPMHKQFGIGSKAAAGLLTAAVLDNPNLLDGRPLREHMAEQGINVTQLESLIGEQLIPKENILLYSEIHIEQHTSLKDAGMQLGFVTTIAGNVRFPPVRFYVEPKHDDLFDASIGGHTGAVEQRDKKFPQLAAAQFMILLDERLDALDAAQSSTKGKTVRLVHTITNMGVTNPGPTTIPTEAFVQVDIRSLDDETIAKAAEIYVSTAEEVVTNPKWKVKVDTSEAKRVIQAVQPMSGELANWFQATAKSLGIRSQLTISGAGHDASNIAAIGIPTIMTFPAHNGLSHDWRELLTNKVGENAFAAGSNFAASISPHAVLITSNDLPLPTRQTQQTFEEALMARGAKPLALAA